MWKNIAVILALVITFFLGAISGAREDIQDDSFEVVSILHEANI